LPILYNGFLNQRGHIAHQFQERCSSSLQHLYLPTI